RIPLNAAAQGVSVVVNYTPRHGYSGSFSSSALRLSVRGVRLPALALATQVQFSRSGLLLKHLTWRSESASGAGIARIHWAPVLNGEANLEVSGKVEPVARLMKWTSLHGGAFQMKIRALDEAGKLSASGMVEARQCSLRYAAFDSGPMNLASSFALDAASLHLDQLRVEAAGGSFTGAGSVQFIKPNPRIALSGVIQKASLTRLLRAVLHGPRAEPLLLYGAEVSGRLQAKWMGALQDFRANFDLQFAPPPGPGRGLVPVSGVAKGSFMYSGAPSLALDEAQLQTPHSSFAAHGSIGFSKPGLRVHYQTSDFEETRPLVETLFRINPRLPLTLKSAATFAGSVAGVLAHPETEGRLAMGEFSYRGWAWGGIEANVTSSAGNLEITAGQLRSGPSIFRFSGSAGLVNWILTPNSPVRLEARASNTSLQGLEDAFGLRYPLTGLITGTLQLRGTPSSLSGGGNIVVTGGELDGETFDRLSANVEIAGSVLNARKVLLNKGAGRVTGWARLDLPNRAFSAAFDGAGLSLAQFKWLAPRESPTIQPVHVRGTAMFHLEGHGTFSVPSARATLDVRNLGFGRSDLGEFQARYSLNGYELNGQGELKGPQGSLQLDSSARLQGEWPAHFSGDFTALHLDPWMRWFAPVPLQTSIAATGAFQGSGPLRKPGELVVRAEAKTLSVEVPGFSLQNAKPVEMTYARRSFATNQFAMLGPASTKLQVRFAAGLNSGHAVSLDVQGDTKAAVLQLADPSLRAAGQLALDFHAQGSATQPALSGSIGVHDVSLRFNGLPVPVAGMNGVITLHGDRVQIGPLVAKSGQSSIRLTGFATLRPSLRYNLLANLDHVRLEYPTDFISLLNGTLRLNGARQGGMLTGNVTVAQMFVGENFNLVNWIGQVGSAMSSVPATPARGYPGKVRLRIHVLTAPEVHLSSPTLSFTAAISTTLRGTLASPVAVGDIHIRSGQALISGNRYQIVRGDVTMTSPVETTPVLDIEAQTQVQGYNLTVDVTGPADRIKLAYRSVPPLPSGQILSLLALGYAPQQAKMTSTGNQEFSALGASALLSQALSSQTTGRVTRLFGVSRIRIDPNMIGATAAGGARITVEEQVAPNVTITYSTNTAVAQQRDIRLQWNLSNRISLFGERDINGVYGFEVRFRHRFQ
ncbi:MAG: translocation/assembly module TamB domain-containing protein, partial [Terriglobia bacterium]